MSSSGDWIKLQRKIFSRWVNQKLSVVNIPVEDALESFKTGVTLIKLMEVLSEKQCTEKYNAAPKMRIQQVDTASKALKFIFGRDDKSCGVEMKNAPSPDNIVDGLERPVLGMIWAIMLKYMRFSDDEDSLNAKDALLMWLQSQTSSYADVEVTNFSTSLHDGKVLTALIHKFRPALVGDWESVDFSDKNANVERLFDLAHRYFKLEKYLTVEEYQKLDEPCRVVYAAEYYHGIAQQRKKDLAARRISKVIKLTIELDAMKAEFNESVTICTAKIKETQVLLGDRTIDNTMAGAKKRIADFYAYKEGDKGVILSEQLKLEAVFNLLSMKLSHNHRPPYVPPAGCSLEDIATAISELEVAEQERNVALHAELNRQIKLVKWDAQHKQRFEKLEAWVAEKHAFLAAEPVVASVSDARRELAMLDAYEQENSSVLNAAVAALKALGADLEREVYERTAEVKGREASVDSSFDELASASAKRRPVLDDHLAREVFKAGVEVLAVNHAAAYEKLVEWFKQKQSYLSEREAIDSVSEAQLYLSFLDTSDKGVALQKGSVFEQLKVLGADIKAKEYATEYSRYVYDKPEEIDARESEGEATFESLAAASAEKRQFLDGQLAREEKKEELRIKYAALSGAFERWSKSVADESAATTFGDSLAEVEAFAAKLAELDAAVVAESDSMRADLNALQAEMDSYQITENVYSKVTSADLDQWRADVDASLAARKSAYEAVLAEEREKDRLCKAFADVAIPFSAWISDNKSAITGSQASLADQLANIEERIANVANESQRLAPIDAAADALDAKNIVDNRHTTLSRQDVHVQWAQFQILLTRKKDQLEKEIELDKLHGLTQEQFDEIKANFKTYDKDGDNMISKKEMKACLYSLGEEVTRSEVDTIASEYGNGETIAEDGFTSYMLALYGDSDSKEEVVASFVLLNDGAEKADLEEMADIMKGDDIQYLKDTMHDGDYTAWTEDVYSR